MESFKANWVTEEPFDVYETFNSTKVMEGDDSNISVHHTLLPFEIGNITFGTPSEEASNMRHSLFYTIVLIFAYAAVFLVGIVGNAMVIFVLTFKRQMRSVTNLFILNLAIADMSVLIFCIPPTLLANIFVPWLLGSFMCKAVAYVQGVSVCASVYSLVAISLDRFLTIKYRMKMPRGLTTFQARVIIVCIWTSALIITFPWLIAFRVIPSGRQNVEYCVESWPEFLDGRLFFVVGNVLFCYGLPLTIILVSNGLVWRQVAQRKVPHDAASPAAIERIHQKTRRGVLKMLSIVSLTFLLSWLPLYLIFLRIKLGGPLSEDMENVVSILMPFAQWLGASNSSCNPILYAFLNQKFRDSFKSLLSDRTLVGSPQNARTLTTYYSNTISLNLQQLCIPCGWRRLNLNIFRYPIDHV